MHAESEFAMERGDGRDVDVLWCRRLEAGHREAIRRGDQDIRAPCDDRSTLQAGRPPRVMRVYAGRIDVVAFRASTGLWPFWGCLLQCVASYPLPVIRRIPAAHPFGASLRLFKTAPGGFVVKLAPSPAASFRFATRDGHPCCSAAPFPLPGGSRTFTFKSPRSLPQRAEQRQSRRYAPCLAHQQKSPAKPGFFLPQNINDHSPSSSS